ncbi:Thrombospondin type 3 repeat-containing protein [Solimonas aquatica]|uniref:Thrombospondin type 3 repeat-containing protein n=1 Tax=Solimonas aquatica TaxID=489703 RepID=A0A1H8ZPQ2_9GAMM|nr:OmpA family protein [Solimonas aquatica]SEP66203.1 Thrombospondin type 3 repeat-containing protein [Solimonas aquatica]
MKRRQVRNVLLGGAAAIGLLGSTVGNAYSPGWYFDLDAYYSQTQDADGVTTQPATAGTSATSCALGNLLGLGSLLGAGSTSTGCLLRLLGPGTSATPGTAAQIYDTSVSYKGGIGGGFGIGYLFEGGLRPEFNFSYTQADWDSITLTGSSATTKLSSNASQKMYRAMLNAWYDFDFGSFVVPYLGAGFGYQRTEVSAQGASSNDNGFAYQLGAGLGFLINQTTTLSLDYRYVSANDPSFDTTDGGKQTLSYKANNIGLGLRYSFGGKEKDSDGDGVPDRLDKCPNTPPNVQVYSNGCPVDMDGDGVPDYLDKCPNTPKGVQVDQSGCPLDSDGDGVPDYLDKCPGTPRGTKVNADGCSSADADGDGVPDDLDKCPNTPAGVAVGPNGCPLDSDGDGIPDYLDECPHSPPGAKVLPNGCALVGDCRKPRPGEQVDSKGCAVQQSFILKGVKFEFDSDRLTKEAMAILDQVAQTLQAYPNVNVEVSGHTDNIGSDSYNLGLSERRANSVKRYLAEHSVKAERMRPVGYGETRPIDSNETEVGRENNRRVELTVIE